jgi:glycine cleavage system transcriptional repressor
MRSDIVLTLTGTDRVGIVEEVTKVLLDLGANVETSRMARLGGEFAMLMLMSVSPDQASDLEAALARLAERGYKIATSETQQTYAEAHPGWLSYRVEVDGADHEGIVHEIASGLSRRGISIESMETSVSQAPVSGSPLFAMAAIVVVPPGLAEAEWLAALDDAGRQSNVDVRVMAL